MRIQTSQAALQHGLSVVARAVAARHSLDQLRHVHLEADDDGLRLTATDTELSIQNSVDAVVSRPGAITVPHRFLNDLITALPSADITLEVADGSFVCQIHGSNDNESSLHGMSPSSYPSLPGTDGGDWVKIVARELREALRHVVFAAATDDGRPVLTGIHFRFDGDKMTLAAADGFRLAVYDMNVASDLQERVEITVPARALHELERLLSDDDSAVEMYIHSDRTYVRFHIRAVQMTAQLIQGNYPSYDQLIPNEYQTRAILAGSVLQGAVRAAAVFARESSGIIRLIFSGQAGDAEAGEESGDGGITLTARAEELGNHKGRVDAAIEGEQSRIAYNVKYLQEVLSISSGGGTEIAMETSGPSNPGVFRVVGRDQYVHVLMPMFVQWDDA